MKFFLLIILTALYLQISTGKSFADVESEQLVFSIAKWFNHKTAAVTINYDGDFRDDAIINQIIKRDLKISFEYVTGPDYVVTERELKAKALYETQNVSFFSHGMQHINYDLVSPEYTEKAFRRSKKLMEKWGLDSRVIAYPFGRAYRFETQKAAFNAGFILGRGVYFREWEEKLGQPLICPDDTSEPNNYFLLPAPLVANDDFKEQNHTNLSYRHEHVKKLLADTLEHKAWVILLYHSLGKPAEWGYYPMSTFEKDLDIIAEKDFWVDHMENIGAYILEKNTTKFTSKKIREDGSSSTYKVTIDDNLNDEEFNQQITIDVFLNSRKSYKYCEIRHEEKLTLPLEKNKFTYNVIPSKKEILLTFKTN